MSDKKTQYATANFTSDVTYICSESLLITCRNVLSLIVIQIACLCFAFHYRNLSLASMLFAISYSSTSMKVS